MKYEYKKIKIDSLKGIKRAEKFHKNKNWNQILIGLDYILFERSN